jgi:hypothetical protein
MAKSRNMQYVSFLDLINTVVLRRIYTLHLYQHVCPSIYSTCLSIYYLSICLSIYLSIHLSIYIVDQVKVRSAPWNCARPTLKILFCQKRHSLLYQADIFLNSIYDPRLGKEAAWSNITWWWLTKILSNDARYWRNSAASTTSVMNSHKGQFLSLKWNPSSYRINISLTNTGKYSFNERELR